MGKTSLISAQNGIKKDNLEYKSLRAKPDVGTKLECSMQSESCGNELKNFENMAWEGADQGRKAASLSWLLVQPSTVHSWKPNIQGGRIGFVHLKFVL